MRERKELVCATWWLPTDTNRCFSLLLGDRCFTFTFAGHTHLCFCILLLRPQKIPTITFQYPGAVNSKLAQTLSFNLQGRDQSFKNFRYCGHEIHVAGSLLLGVYKDWVFSQWRFIVSTSNYISYTLLSIYYVAGTVGSISHFILQHPHNSEVATATVPILPLRKLRG